MHGACTEYASTCTDTHSFKRKSLIGSICIKFKLSRLSDMHSAQKIVKNCTFFPSSLTFGHVLATFLSTRCPRLLIEALNIHRVAIPTFNKNKPTSPRKRKTTPSLIPSTISQECTSQ